MKEEEFYQKELNLIKGRLSEAKEKINVNRQQIKNLKDKRETLLVDIALKAGNLSDNLQKSQKYKAEIRRLEDEFNDLKATIRGLELREKIFKSIIDETKTKF